MGLAAGDSVVTTGVTVAPLAMVPKRERSTSTVTGLAESLVCTMVSPLPLAFSAEVVLLLFVGMILSPGTM